MDLHSSKLLTFLLLHARLGCEMPFGHEIAPDAESRYCGLDNLKVLTTFECELLLHTPALDAMVRPRIRISSLSP
ncbi:hypothetical protein GY45DRAFT_1075317 [Cubamyces sp. BRFM 1775]|nr:hypothetical protein GY45DRAFT_1075317 [Cubamyces sp. BRFM 1775]